MKEVIVESDKTKNHWKMTKSDYRKHLDENVTAEYQKCPQRIVDNVNREACEIAKKHQLADRMQQPKKTQCRITFKDHKKDHVSRPKFRLINGANTDMGQITKEKLQTVIKSVKAKNT